MYLSEQRMFVEIAKYKVIWSETLNNYDKMIMSLWKQNSEFGVKIL